MSQAAPIMRSRYPQIEVDSNSLYVQQGNIWSSAGGSAGIDLALAIVREDFGEKIAMDIAKRLVIYAHRPGGQQQFSSMLINQYNHVGKQQKILCWIKDNAVQIQSIEEIAEYWGMSLRNFHRCFIKDVGETPAQYLEKIRIENAIMLMQTKQQPLKIIAQLSGFGTDQRLIKAFKRHFGITPSEYREHHTMPAVFNI